MLVLIVFQCVTGSEKSWEPLRTGGTEHFVSNQHLETELGVLAVSPKVTVPGAIVLQSNSLGQIMIIHINMFYHRIPSNYFQSSNHKVIY